MEVLFILIGLAIPLSGIAGFVMALRLRTRVEMLETRLAAAEARLGTGTALGMAPAPETAPPPPEPVIAPQAVEPPVPPEAPKVVPPITAPPPASAASTPGLEEQLGTRWAVWVGGIALALGGVFLVRYSIEQGLLGPGARIAAGSLFALLLAGAGEWLRRRDATLDLGGFPSAHIPSVLTGAGVLTAFATVYAAHALYGLIGPATAFVLLGAISLLGLVASALHGPALAGLGLVASLASPLLVSSDRPQLWPVVLYLAFATGAAYGLARLRLWRWLAAAAAAGAILWTLVLTVSAGNDVLPVAVHLLVQVGFACFVLGLSPYRGTPDPEARPDLMASALLLVFAVVGVLIEAWLPLGSLRPVFAAALAALFLGTALRSAPAAAAAAWAGVVAVGTLLVWPVTWEIAGEMPTVLPGGPGPVPQPAALTTFLSFASVTSGVIALAGLRRVALSPSLRWSVAGFYLAAATITPLGALVAAWWRVAALDRSLPFALLAGLLAAGFIAATRWLHRRQGRAQDAAALAVGVAASAALAALALGLTFALDKGMLTVAFALMALGTAWVADRTGLTVLRYAVGAIGLLVLGRLVWSPTIFGGDLGAIPVFNWLLWGYGVPALAFFGASRLLGRAVRDRVTRLAESLALVFAAFLVFFEIRHAIHGRITALDSNLLEAGLMATAALAFAILLVRVDLRRPDIVYRVGSMAFSIISVAIAAIGLLVVYNPLLGGDPVPGGAILNALLPAYLLPAVLAGGLALAARRSRPTPYVLGMGVLALVLHLAYMIMEIRILFQGPWIGYRRPVLEAEQWSYSVALLACGLALLAIGTVMRSRFLRLASVVYLMLAVVKVFVIDLSNLEGIMRALSFIGLGGTLIGIALVYQRILARRPEAAGP